MNSRRTGRRRKPISFPRLCRAGPSFLVGLVVAIFAAVVLYTIFRPRPDIWTNDAYVTVHYATIAPRISGQVATVPVDDNDVVKTGQVLATLDPRDNETALASAEAAVARDRSRFDEISATVSRQPSIIEEQQAAVASARAKARFRAGQRAPLRQPRHDGSRHNAGTPAGRHHASAGSSLAGWR